MAIRWPATPRDLPAGRPADLVLRGGAIHTGSSGAAGTGTTGTGVAPAFVPAVAVTDGTITALGASDAVMRQAGPSTTVVDLEGRTVVAGLIDSHVHVVRAGQTWDDEVFWYEVPSLEAGLALLRERVAATPAGTWIRVVGGWHPGQFREGRGPTHAELTALAPEHPVYVQLLYEEAVLNAAALRAAGIGAATPDPPLGAIERDAATGLPTGTVRGIGAFGLVLGQVPALPHDAQVRSTAAALRRLTAYGLTGAIDPGGFGMVAEAYEPLFQLWREGGVPLKLRLYTSAATRGREREELDGWARHARPGFGDRWLRHVGIGEIALFGCHDLEGLTDHHVDAATREELAAVLLDLARRGWPVHLHAILDSTATAIVDVWERVHEEVPITGLRWSLAHAEPISEANLDRVRALGAGIAVQDRLVYRATDSAARWGEATVRRSPPLRAILERGIPLGAGTDATRVASPNPWVSLWWLVTGRTLDDGPERGDDQCLSRSEALAAYTRGSAWFSFEEHDRGSIEVGRAADLAVLDDDYFTVPADDIRRLGADLTVVEGRVVHASGPFDGLAG